MGMRTLAIGLSSVLAATGCALPSDLDEDTGEVESALTQEEYRDLAEHWAPRIYQDTDSSYYKGDYITRFNFDGDYVGKNNWENLDPLPTVPAHVYYAVSETLTHHFISYEFFHPRDWHELIAAERHENDIEGVVLAIKKDGGYGALVAMESQAHSHFHQYGYAAGITTGSDDINGTITLHGGSHPRIFIEAKGHGVYNCDARCDSAPGGDGIVYHAGATADSPASGSGNWSSAYSYRLIAMDADGSIDGDQGLWHRRNDICDTCTFASWGRIRGDANGLGADNTNSASTPWGWDDEDDGQSFAGDSICDPAKFFDIHLSGAPFDGGFSHAYVNHLYRTHTVEVLAARSDANRDTLGGKSDIYVRVTAPGAPDGTDEVVNSSAWKRNEATVGTWYSFAYGASDAEGQDFGDTVRTHSFCRRGSPSISVSVHDSDSDSDDAMGTVTVSNTVDHSAGIDLGDGAVKFRMTKH